jgi:predicted dithiol-disulfide oxidoreductase (DUF899 family)
MRTLGELFDRRSQLIVYHFMYPPDWDAGCPHCSFGADNFDGVDVHLNQHDVTFVAISRAPLPKLAAYRDRMVWSLPWLSSSNTDFNYDYAASFTPEQVASGERLYNFGTIEPGLEDREGVSVFVKDDDGRIFHTYAAYARGIDLINGAYHLLDLVPKGRDEAGHETRSSGCAGTTSTAGNAEGQRGANSAAIRPSSSQRTTPVTDCHLATPEVLCEGLPQLISAGLSSVSLAAAGHGHGVNPMHRRSGARAGRRRLRCVAAGPREHQQETAKAWLRGDGRWHRRLVAPAERLIDHLPQRRQGIADIRSVRRWSRRSRARWRTDPGRRSG